MKRIPNKTAIATICYGIKGTQKIKVYDYETDYDCMHDQNEIIVFDGLNKDFIGWKYCKHTEAEYRGMRAEGDTIIFKTFTKYEEYK